MLANKLCRSLEEQKKLEDNLEKLREVGIITGERSFNEQLLAKGFIPGINRSKVMNLYDSKQHDNMTEQTEGTGNSLSVIITGANVMPFKFQEVNQIKPDQGTLDDIIDFGNSNYDKDLKQRVIAKIRELHTAYAGDYSIEKERLAQKLEQSVSSNMIRKLNTGLVQPASSIVAKTGIKKIGTLLAEHNKQVIPIAIINTVYLSSLYT